MSTSQPANTIARHLRVALVQTQVPEGSWSRFPGRNANIEWRVWQELRLALRGLQDESAAFPPKIVLIPELSVPETRVHELKQMASSLKAVLMCGVDYKRDFKTKPKEAMNRACIIVPYDWPACARVGSPKEVFVGKSYPSLKEDALLAARGWEFKRDATVYLFTSRAYGRIGVCICFDFLDVERHLMYRGQVQHLVVLSYNRDFESFYYNAEALARTLYCNVVVCNTGTHGGSLAVTPYYEPFKRTIYRHQGRRLSNVQIVELPVRDLMNAQAGQFDDERWSALKRSARRGVTKKSEEGPTWKSRPPGYPNKGTSSAPPDQSEFALDD
jgi:hypothetical protein